MGMVLAVALDVVLMSRGMGPAPVVIGAVVGVEATLFVTDVFLPVRVPGLALFRVVSGTGMGGPAGPECRKNGWTLYTVRYLWNK